MNSIVVGIDGTERGQRALEWAARSAEREGAGLTLLAIIDESAVQAYGTPAEDLRSSIEQMLEAERARMIERHPGLEASTAIVTGKIVECLADQGRLELLCRNGTTYYRRPERERAPLAPPPTL